MTVKINSVAAAVLGVALFFAVGGARADLIVDGGFESTTSGPGQLGYNTSVAGWTTAPNTYNFVFASGTADTTGAIGQYGPLMLWGPGNGSSNGMPASSPNGGNFIAADGAYETGPIQQTISGLTVGNVYQVSFYWAAAQQSGYTGANTEQWVVSFGGDPTQSTAVYDNSSEGFSGWMQQSFDFTADSASDLISFLAVGTPNGEPPFSLLDGVSVNAVPEPSAAALLLTGLLGLGFIWRRRKSSKTSARAAA